MKKHILLAGLVTCLSAAVGIGFSSRLTAQAPNAGIPHKIGLIDMGRVFKSYEKFNALREDLKAEIQKSDEKAKQMAVQIQQLRKEMQEFEPDSPEYLQREKRITQLSTEFETFRKTAQRDFLRKESQIYETIYLEVVDVVKKYAEYYKYTLILRYNGEKIDASDPKSLIQSLNRQVVYHRPEDDITDSVIEYLNRRYQSAAAAPSGGTRK